MNTVFKLGDWLFALLMLTKNADPNKYGFSGYGIGFHTRSQFLSLNCESSQSVTIFVVDKSSSMLFEN